MWIVWTLSGIALFLLLCFVFWMIALLHVRRDKALWKPFQGVPFAHRGLHDEKRPENSCAAFEASVERGYGFEFDLHLTRDGKLVVFHDGTTGRMCGDDLRINGSSLEELRALRLPDGSQIPTFEELLAIAGGKVPLLIELKNDGNNGKELVAAAMKILENYRGEYLVESFDPRVLFALKKASPQTVRGQLCQNFLANRDAPLYMRPLLYSMVSNLWTKPDFVAYNTAHRGAFPLRMLEKRKCAICFWTVRGKEDLARCLRDGQNPIFERVTPEDLK